TFVQVILLAILTAVPSAVYVYFQFYPAPPLVTMLCTFAWFCIHGAPPIIYLTLNHSVRDSLLRQAKIVP
ncbi:Protein Y55F3C.10, partial [Aphelenchoides avenae]